MRYYRLERTSRKRAEMAQLLKLWLESTCIDEFKLKAAAAGLEISLKDRFVFWTYHFKVEHPILYWTSVISIIVTTIVVGTIIAELSGMPILCVPWTFCGTLGWCAFFTSIGNKHQQISVEENGPIFYI